MNMKQKVTQNMSNNINVIDKDANVGSKIVASLASVNKTYQLGGVDVNALQNIDLKINEGQFSAIFGPSGSGKSTLLNIIGLVDQPDSGVVSIMGEDVSGLSDSQLADFRNANLGFVFQNFNLLPMFSALENVILPLQISKSDKSEIKERGMLMLDKVGLSDKANVRPDNLSGGQQQRVAIARALVSNPKIIVADEPTANLDSKSSETVIQLMRDLNHEMKTTILISTHDPRVLSNVNSKIELVDGQLVQEKL